MLLLLLIADHTFAQIFSDVGESSGVIHEVQLNKYIGGGTAILDYDNDGFEDIYLTGGNLGDKLYRNLGDGSFTDVSESAGISFTSSINTLGVASGDIDNDGYRDLFISTGEDLSNILLRNNGDGTFTDISEPAGIVHTSYSMSVTFGDVNHDGFLDIYVANFLLQQGYIFDLDNNIVGFKPNCLPNFLYINQGNNTFLEKAASYGVNDEGCGLATTFSDYNNDRHQDILVANDFGPWHIATVLYENNYPQEYFIDLTDTTSFSSETYGMGIAVGDINNDLILDYYVTNLGRNVLFKGSEEGIFSDISTIAGVEDDSINGDNATGWGTVFMDYDNDGFLDLYINNGQIPSGLEFSKNAEDNPDKFYRNNGDNTFSDISTEAGIGNDLMGKGAASFDFDQDGDLDLVSIMVKKDPNLYVPANFYQNNTVNENHWLKAKLQGKRTNRDAIGSQIRAYLTNGSRLIREIDGGSSFASQNSVIAHFGLGLEDVDSLKISWLSGSDNIIYGLNRDRLIEITEDISSITVEPECSGNPTSIMVENTTEDSIYYLYDMVNESIIGDEQLSDGTPLYFSTGNVESDGKYQVRTNQSGYILAIDSIIRKKIAAGQIEITVSDNIMEAPEGLSYQWFFNDVLISDNKTIEATQSGNYRVEVIDYYGCSASSETLSFQITNIGFSTEKSIHLFPNPTHGIVYVEDSRINSNSNLSMIDTQGRLIELEINSQNEGRIVLNLEQLKPGIYYLILLFSEKESEVVKVAKSIH